MTPAEFIRTIYLGDRGCKSIEIDGWTKRVIVHVDLISRVRGPNWDFYSAEDIHDGRIVFSGVQSFRLEPSGPIPNDFISDLSVSEEDGELVFTMAIGAVADDGASSEVLVHLRASAIHLEDPLRPGESIRT